MRKLILSLFILSFFVFKCNAQDDTFDTNTRTVLINSDEFVIKAKILNQKENIETIDDLKYYCYNNDRIIYNRGGINGNLLHGTYSVCNKEGLLIQQGEYNFGLKNGKWKSWNVSGELLKVESWQKGLLHGEQKFFSESGKLLETKLYKKGIEVKSNDNSFFQRIFKEKESEPVDSTKNEIESTKTK